jgi:NAD(P)-dependent dehydrogenase (short-subunit alcohol dehydrogenase family)
MSLRGKVAFVTGGSSGIGKAAARLLARDGVKVAIVGTTEADVNQAAEEMRREGGEVLPLVVDVSSVEQVRGGIEETVAKWGRLDFVLANAGINGVWAPIEELEPDEWDRVQAVNLKGTYLTIKYAVPHLKRQGGSVVITSSVNGTRMFSNVGASAYATTKAGQVAFAKMMALELGQDQIRVNVICPGAIETAIDSKTDRSRVEDLPPVAEYPQGKIPLTEGEPGTAEQVGELIRFLFSDATSHISGTEIWIDGAQSLLQG